MVDGVGNVYAGVAANCALYIHRPGGSDALVAPETATTNSVVAPATQLLDGSIAYPCTNGKIYVVRKSYAGETPVVYSPTPATLGTASAIVQDDSGNCTWLSRTTAMSASTRSAAPERRSGRRPFQ